VTYVHKGSCSFTYSFFFDSLPFFSSLRQQAPHHSSLPPPPNRVEFHPTDPIKVYTPLVSTSRVEVSPASPPPESCPQVNLSVLRLERLFLFPPPTDGPVHVSWMPLLFDLSPKPHLFPPPPTFLHWPLRPKEEPLLSPFSFQPYLVQYAC